MNQIYRIFFFFVLGLNIGVSFYFFSNSESAYLNLTLNNINFNISGYFLSNFNHINIIHFLMNMFVFYQIYLITKNNVFFQKLIIHVTVICFFFANFFIFHFSVYLYQSEPFILLGFSTILFAYIGALFKQTKMIGYSDLIFLFIFHIIFIFFVDTIGIAWQAHLIGFLIGFSYQYIFKSYNKVQEIYVDDILNRFVIYEHSLYDFFKEAGIKFNRINSGPLYFSSDMNFDEQNFKMLCVMPPKNMKLEERFQNIFFYILKELNYDSGYYKFKHSK